MTSISNNITIESLKNNYIGLYQYFIDLDSELDFKTWIKTSDKSSMYLIWQKQLHTIISKEHEPITPSPLINFSKSIVEELILPSNKDNMFSAQIDILQELEGPPYYGSLHTAELLSLILAKLQTHYMSAPGGLQ